MQLSELSKGTLVRIAVEDHHFFFRKGVVLSVFHNHQPDLIYIKISLESGEVVQGFQPEHLMAA